MAAVKLFMGGVIVFMSLDGLWLGLIMRSFYRTELTPLGRLSTDGSLAPVWAAVVPVYVLLVLGLMMFVLPRAAGHAPIVAARLGAAFGVITYGVYDLTNYATLRNYSLRLALVDMAWGAIVCGAVASAMQAFDG
jgi:uncharacterized membrane protein